MLSINTRQAENIKLQFNQPCNKIKYVSSANKNKYIKVLKKYKRYGISTDSEIFGKIPKAE